MSTNKASFGAESVAVDFAYGITDPWPDPLTVIQGNSVTGAGTIQLQNGYVTLSDGTTFAALSTNAPVIVGNGANAETVTPSAVSNGTANVPFSATITATFSNTHGLGESVKSGTVGLQEALNYRSAKGGGFVILTPEWTTMGGTNAMIAAATVPATVGIIDNRTGAGGQITNVQVTIANPQVFTNNTVPTQILPIPGATSMWDILDMVVENKNAGVAYTGGGAMALYYGTTSAGVLASATIAATFLTSPTVPHVIKVAGALVDTAASSILNKGVVFTNPSADFAAGTGTVIVKVAARLLTGM